MSTPVFTPQDAQNLIALAESAPLQNMQAAVQAQGILKRFAEWFNAGPVIVEQQKDPAPSEVPAGTVPTGSPLVDSALQAADGRKMREDMPLELLPDTAEPRLLASLPVFDGPRSVPA